MSIGRRAFSAFLLVYAVASIAAFVIFGGSSIIAVMMSVVLLGVDVMTGLDRRRSAKIAASVELRRPDAETAQFLTDDDRAWLRQHGGWTDPTVKVIDQVVASVQADERAAGVPVSRGEHVIPRHVLDDTDRKRRAGQVVASVDAYERAAAAAEQAKRIADLQDAMRRQWRIANEVIANAQLDEALRWRKRAVMTDVPVARMLRDDEQTPLAPIGETVVELVTDDGTVVAEVRNGRVCPMTEK